MGAHDRPPLLDLARDERDMQDALRQAADDTLALTRRVQRLETARDLTLTVIHWAEHDRHNPEALWAALGHIRAILRGGRLLDLAAAHEALDRLGGDR